MQQLAFVSQRQWGTVSAFQGEGAAGEIFSLFIFSFSDSAFCGDPKKGPVYQKPDADETGAFTHKMKWVTTSSVAWETAKESERARPPHLQ